MAKMTMRVINGVRIRRMTRKIVEDAWCDDSMWVRVAIRRSC